MKIKAVLLIALISCLAVMTAGAQEVMLYDGDATVNQGGITLGAWGSGYAAESYDAHFVGPRVLKVLSQGYYQGAVLVFDKPPSLENYLEDENSYLELYIKPAVVPPTSRAQSAQRAGQSSTRSRQAARPGAGGGPRGGPGRAGAAGRPSAARQAQRPAEEPAKPGEPVFLLRNLRVILTTDKGALIVQDWPLTSRFLVPGGWNKIAIPMNAFKTVKPEKGARLQSIRLFADRADIFYVSRISLVVDNAPMRLAIAANPDEVRTGEAVKFFADVAAGDAITLVNWDFDTADGIQTNAQGEEVAWVYKEPGTYTVTCTAEDVYGNKDAVRQTLQITVTGAGVL